MPTYRARSTQPGINAAGSTVIVQAGQTIACYGLYSDPPWEKISDAPYWNPAAAVHAVSSAGQSDPKTVMLDSETDSVEIYNESDAEITVFLQSEENRPGLKVFSNSIRTVSGIRGKSDRLILQFSQAGACAVSEIKE